MKPSTAAPLVVLVLCLAFWVSMPDPEPPPSPETIRARQEMEEHYQRGQRILIQVHMENRDKLVRAYTETYLSYGFSPAEAGLYADEQWQEELAHLQEW